MSFLQSRHDKVDWNETVAQNRELSKMSIEGIIKWLNTAMLNKSQLQMSQTLSLDSNDSSSSLLTSLNGTFNPKMNLSMSNLEQQLRNWSLHVVSGERGPPTRDIIVVLLYTLILIVAMFGNALVCQVVFRRSALRSTTNLFIGNLSISDLLMTVFNIPFHIARTLMANWPFGTFICGSLTFVHVVSVNVSTFTMTCIAFDRYQVIANPLKLRASMNMAKLKIAIIWIAAMSLSIPHPVFTDVVEVHTFRTLLRCRMVYPAPAENYRMWLTMLTLATQYVIPLVITGIIYGKIVYLVWYRQVIGTITENQRIKQQKAKWKTIKMLIIVVIIFALCWLPLNTYHAYHDSSGIVSPRKHNSTVLLICHWIAMSSVCYNPFIYCWLNDTFRSAAISHFRCVTKLLHGHRDSPVLPPMHPTRSPTVVFSRWGCQPCSEPMLGATSSSLRSPDSLQDSLRSPTNVTLISQDNITGRKRYATKCPKRRFIGASRKWSSLDLGHARKQNRFNQRSESFDNKILMKSRVSDTESVTEV